MKKIVLTMVLAALVAVGLAGCKKEAADLGSAPVMEDLFITKDSNSNTRLTQVYIYPDKATYDADTNKQDNEYIVVFKYTDSDIDVCELQYSFDGINYTSYEYTQAKKTEYLEWSSWVFYNSNSINLRFRVKDSKGNLSNVLTYSVTKSN